MNTNEKITVDINKVKKKKNSGTLSTKLLTKAKVIIL